MTRAGLRPAPTDKRRLGGVANPTTRKAFVAATESQATAFEPIRRENRSRQKAGKKPQEKGLRSEDLSYIRDLSHIRDVSHIADLGRIRD